MSSTGKRIMKGIKFLVVNDHTTHDVGKKIYEMCLPVIERGGYAVMYLPHSLSGIEGFEFLGINFHNLQYVVADLLSKRKLERRLLIAKDRESYEDLLSALGKSKDICGITMLESFIRYVMASKKGKRRINHYREEILMSIARYRTIGVLHILLWLDYNIKRHSASRTYLYNAIRRYGEIVRF